MLAVQADVTKVKEVEGAVTAAVAKFGKLGIVFANAGIPGATPIGNTSLGLFWRNRPNQLDRGVLHGAG